MNPRSVIESFNVVEDSIWGADHFQSAHAEGESGSGEVEAGGRYGSVSPRVVSTFYAEARQCARALVFLPTRPLRSPIRRGDVYL